MFLEKWYGCLPNLVQRCSPSDGFFAGQLYREIDAFLYNIGFLLFGQLVSALVNSLSVVLLNSGKGGENIPHANNRVTLSHSRILRFASLRQGMSPSSDQE